MDLERSVRCEQGAADLWTTASSADLEMLVCVSRFLDCEFVVLCLGFGLWVFGFVFWVFEVCRVVQIASNGSR